MSNHDPLSQSDHDVLVTVAQNAKYILESLAELKRETVEVNRKLEEAKNIQVNHGHQITSLEKELGSLKDRFQQLSVEATKENKFLSEKVQKLENELENNLVRMKTILWIGTPVYGVIMAIVYEIIKGFMQP